MEDRPNATEGDPDSRAPAFPEIGTECNEQVLDIRPGHIGSDWIREDCGESPSMPCRQWHSVTLRHYRIAGNHWQLILVGSSSA